MRGRMNDVKSYVPPFQVGAPMDGGAVGKVVESRSPHFREGETVFHMMGWREGAAGPPRSSTRCRRWGSRTSTGSAISG
jgi:NADPH-dependent curcumin reductase CurA